MKTDGKKRKFKFNKVVKYLILSDLVFYSGLGLISPVFAIFIVDYIQGGSVVVVGLASAIYLILLSILRVPIGILLDTIDGETDDYDFTVIGLLICALVPFGYMVSTKYWHIYIAEAVYALGMAMSLSGWSAIFTRHIDKGEEATEWGLSSTAYGIGSGIAGAIGGYAVTAFGFRPVFVVVAVIGLLGVSLLLFIKKDIKKSDGFTHPFSLREMFTKSH